MIISSRYIPKYGTNVGQNLVAGFNLHYLPLKLVQAFIRAQTFQTDIAIASGLRHPIIKRAYRTYKLNSIMGTRRIDWRTFLSRISISRQLKPAERESLIALVEAQIVSNSRDMTSINRIVANFLQQRGHGEKTPGQVSGIQPIQKTPTIR